MMRIEIVSHCWRYSKLLTYQLSSLLLHPPSTTTTMTVFYAEEDEATKKVVDYFGGLTWPANVQLRPWRQPPGQLRLRLIGRNLAALSTNADWIWFADCDHVFGPGAIDALATFGADSGPLLFPRCVLAHRQTQLGDEAVAAAAGPPRTLTINVADFEPKRMRRAIGGLQIVHGDIVRRIGYCRESRWQHRTSEHWRANTEDIWFRKGLGTGGRGVEIPNLYRIRHSVAGYRAADVEL